jgi:hypothetical protein
MPTAKSPKAQSENVRAMLHRPDDDVAKQFGDGAEMDDSVAYLESFEPASFTRQLGMRAKAKSWRAAKSLTKLRTQLNAAFPKRSKASDGIIGDLAHCPGSSDHCPNIVVGGVGIVTAFDATHDPKHGCDMNKVVKAIRDSRDSRIKYIIWNKRICSSKPQGSAAAWAWRTYKGKNGHTKHAHFSVLGLKGKYDSQAPWKII